MRNAAWHRGFIKEPGRPTPSGVVQDTATPLRKVQARSRVTLGIEATQQKRPKNKETEG